MRNSKVSVLQGFKTSTVFLILTVAFMAAASCGSSSSGGGDKKPAASSVTTAGGLATISTGNLVIAFVPSYSGIIAVPIAQSGFTYTTAAYGDAKLNETALKQITINTSFSLGGCAADATSLKVVCIGYDSSKVAIIDVSGYIANGSVPTASEYDLGNSVTGSFSGGTCINCGVIIDSADHGFIVSSGDGYRVVNYTGIVLKSFLSNPTATTPIDLSTENFAYDPLKNRIYSPEYGSGGTNSYLWVIDVGTSKIYHWNKRMVDTTVDSSNGLPELAGLYITQLTPDAASIDSTTGVLSLGHEWTPLLLILNMNAATFDDMTSTFEAPYEIIPLENVYSPTTWLTTGMVIEPSSHLLFLEEEFGDGIGVAQLPVSSAAGSVTVTSYTSAQIPTTVTTFCPAISSWESVGDPHGLSAFTAIIGGKPMGLLIDVTASCLAIVDLKDLLVAPKGTGTSANQVSSTYDLLANHIISFISLK